MTADLPAAVPQAAARLAPIRPRAVHPASKGANSVVYRVDCGTVTYALKRYPKHENDRRDRQQIEWQALGLLRARGLDQVPKPIGLDLSGRFTLMEWIDGDPISDCLAGDLDDALAFVAAVFDLSDEPKAGAFASASEACLDAQAIVDQIDRRRSGLIGHDVILRFLKDDLEPAFNRALRLMSPERLGSKLPSGLRRLVPADFGFHNALREPGGRLRYIDFDYFGWDDPAKLAADFVLHPAMTLSDRATLDAVSGFAAAIPIDKGFIHRLHERLPLFAVRWSLIVLNRFREDRRHDTTSNAGMNENVMLLQIRKGRHIIDRGWSIRDMIENNLLRHVTC